MRWSYVVIQCWANVVDGGPTLDQYGANVIVSAGKAQVAQRRKVTRTSQHFSNC